MTDTDIHLFPAGFEEPSLCRRHQSRETVAQPDPKRRLCAVCAFRAASLTALVRVAFELGCGPSASYVDAQRESVRLTAPDGEPAPFDGPVPVWESYLPKGEIYADMEGFKSLIQKVDTQ